MKTSSLALRITLPLILSYSLASEACMAEPASVTTYVARVQEERQTTRWTLTEWLRIKERMKMMDLWMAMFSNPDKDRFRPELNVTWMQTRSRMTRNVVGSEGSDEGTAAGHTGRAQFWMTNLLSSSLGVRMLNVDFGIEAGQHDSGGMKRAVDQIAMQSPRVSSSWYSVNFRLFGKSIQDSTLVFKYGMLQTSNSLKSTDDLNSQEAMTRNNFASGTMAGAEMQLYLINWLGAEGTYHRYMPTQVVTNDHTLQGTYGEALGFIEISVLRLMAGRYEERWTTDWLQEGTSSQTREWGYIAGIKLQI